MTEVVSGVQPTAVTEVVSGVQPTAVTEVVSGVQPTVVTEVVYGVQSLTFKRRRAEVSCHRSGGLKWPPLEALCFDIYQSVAALRYCRADDEA